MNKIYHVLMHYFSVSFSYYLLEINGNNRHIKMTLKAAFYSFNYFSFLVIKMMGCVCMCYILRSYNTV